MEWPHENYNLISLGYYCNCLMEQTAFILLEMQNLRSFEIPCLVITVALTITTQE
jgi:hypothetical protein